MLLQGEDQEKKSPLPEVADRRASEAARFPIMVVITEAIVVIIVVASKKATQVDREVLTVTKGTPNSRQP